MPHFFKVDTQNWEVRKVFGGPLPELSQRLSEEGKTGFFAKDEDGDECCDNTHFLCRDAAVSKLKSEAFSNLELSIKDVHRLRAELDKAERVLVEAALSSSAIFGNL